MGIMLAEYLSFLKNTEIHIAEPQDFRAKFIEKNTNFNVYTEDDDIKFDLIFTACPVLETHYKAVEQIANSGVINFFGGLPKGAKDLDVSTNYIHYKEIVLTGSHGSATRHHKEAIKLIENGSIDLEYLITHRFGLDEINQAFDMAYSGMGQKIILRP